MKLHCVCSGLLVFIAGCTSEPEAPPLTDESVYQNDTIGLKFLVPAGWSIESRATLPSGNLSKPIVLVSYVGGVEKPATFRVVAADLPNTSDLRQYLVSHNIGPEQWTAQSQIDDVSINGDGARRFTLTRIQGKTEHRREVTAFRRGERVYFFLVDFASTDSASRDAVRASIDTLSLSK